MVPSGERTDYVGNGVRNELDRKIRSTVRRLAGVLAYEPQPHVTVRPGSVQLPPFNEGTGQVEQGVRLGRGEPDDIADAEDVDVLLLDQRRNVGERSEERRVGKGCRCGAWARQ